MKRNHHFCSSRGVPKSSWGPLGGILSASWRLPGGLGGVLRRLGSVLGLLECSWTSLEASGTFQKHSRSVPSSSKRRSRRSKTLPRWLHTASEASWERLGSILLENLIFDGCMKRNYHFCSSRGPPKPSWGPLGCILDASWRLPGGLGGVLERLGSVLGLLGRSWRSKSVPRALLGAPGGGPRGSKTHLRRLQTASKASWERLGSASEAYC